MPEFEVSICLTITAPTEDEAVDIFKKKVVKEDNESFDVEGT